MHGASPSDERRQHRTAEKNKQSIQKTMCNGEDEGGKHRRESSMCEGPNASRSVWRCTAATNIRIRENVPLPAARRATTGLWNSRRSLAKETKVEQKKWRFRPSHASRLRCYAYTYGGRTAPQAIPCRSMQAERAGKCAGPVAGATKGLGGENRKKQRPREKKAIGLERGQLLRKVERRP